MSDRFQLAISYFESVMGKSLQQIPPVSVSGMGMVEIIWPLNEMFRPFLSRIRTIKYDLKHEAAADKAIELYVKNPGPNIWDESARLPGIMLLWLHSMPLPFPPEDRSAFELPAGTRSASMTLH